MLINVNYSTYNSQIETATMEKPGIGEMVFQFITDETDPENPVQKLQVTNFDEFEATTEYQFTKAELYSFQRLIKNLMGQFE